MSQHSCVRYTYAFMADSRLVGNCEVPTNCLETRHHLTLRYYLQYREGYSRASRELPLSLEGERPVVTTRIFPRAPGFHLLIVSQHRQPFNWPQARSILMSVTPRFDRTDRKEPSDLGKKQGYGTEDATRAYSKIQQAETETASSGKGSQVRSFTDIPQNDLSLRRLLSLKHSVISS